MSELTIPDWIKTANITLLSMMSDKFRGKTDKAEKNMADLAALEARVTSEMSTNADENYAKYLTALGNNIQKTKKNLQ